MPDDNTPPPDENIAIFGLAEEEEEQRAWFGGKRPDELRYARAEVSVGRLREQVEQFLGSLDQVLAGARAKVAGYTLDEITVSAAVTASGSVSILGTGATVGGEGGLSFTFRRSQGT